MEKGKKVKSSNSVLAEAQELSKQEFQKDTSELSDLLTKWLRDRQYILAYDVLWSAEGRMVVYPRLRKEQKSNG